MREIEINNKTYQVIENYDELTIKKLIAIDETQIKEDEDEDLIYSLIDRLSILIDIDSQILIDLPHTELSELLSILDFLSEDYTLKDKHILDIDGKLYGLDYNIESFTTPQLLKFMASIKSNQFIDFDQFLKSDKRLMLNNLHIICAIFYRPIVKKTKKSYTIEKYDIDTLYERADLFFEKMPTSYALSLLDFLYALVLN